MLYFAYGSNLNKRQMSVRCPAARPIRKLMLPGMRLVFRSVADIEPAADGAVHGGLWSITAACERALDRYEGVSGGFYYKDSFTVQVKHGDEVTVEDVLVYVMCNGDSYYPPQRSYYASIREGYRDFGISEKHLRAALEFTYEQEGLDYA